MTEFLEGYPDMPPVEIKVAPGRPKYGQQDQPVDLRLRLSAVPTVPGRVARDRPFRGGGHGSDGTDTRCVHRFVGEHLGEKCSRREGQLGQRRRVVTVSALLDGRRAVFLEVLFCELDLSAGSHGSSLVGGPSRLRDRTVGRLSVELAGRLGAAR